MLVWCLVVLFVDFMFTCHAICAILCSLEDSSWGLFVVQQRLINHVCEQVWTAMLMH